MPVWAALSASAYAMLISYHGMLLWDLGIAKWRIALNLGIKIIILFFAMSYWDAPVCEMLAGSVGLGAVIFAGALTLQEAVFMFQIALVWPEERFKNDDLAILVSVFGGVVFPAAIYITAAAVALGGWCSI